MGASGSAPMMPSGPSMNTPMMGLMMGSFGSYNYSSMSPPPTGLTSTSPYGRAYAPRRIFPDMSPVELHRARAKSTAFDAWMEAGTHAIEKLRLELPEDEDTQKESLETILERLPMLQSRMPDINHHLETAWEDYMGTKQSITFNEFRQLLAGATEATKRWTPQTQRATRVYMDNMAKQLFKERDYDAMMELVNGVTIEPMTLITPRVCDAVMCDAETQYQIFQKLGVNSQGLVSKQQFVSLFSSAFSTSIQPIAQEKFLDAALRHEIDMYEPFKNVLDVMVQEDAESDNGNISPIETPTLTPQSSFTRPHQQPAPLVGTSAVPPSMFGPNPFTSMTGTGGRTLSAMPPTLSMSNSSTAAPARPAAQPQAPTYWNSPPSPPPPLNHSFIPVTGPRSASPTMPSGASAPTRTTPSSSPTRGVTARPSPTHSSGAKSTTNAEPQPTTTPQPVTPPRRPSTGYTGNRSVTQFAPASPPTMHNGDYSAYSSPSAYGSWGPYSPSTPFGNPSYGVNASSFTGASSWAQFGTAGSAPTWTAPSSPPRQSASSLNSGFSNSWNPNTANRPSTSSYTASRPATPPLPSYSTPSSLAPSVSNANWGQFRPPATATSSSSWAAYSAPSGMYGSGGAGAWGSPFGGEFGGPPSFGGFEGPSFGASSWDSFDSPWGSSPFGSPSFGGFGF